MLSGLRLKHRDISNQLLLFLRAFPATNAIMKPKDFTILDIVRPVSQLIYVRFNVVCNVSRTIECRFVYILIFNH